ncbi:hypothetical protein F4778DRAFT_797328 [Xylariomycetidae sp. FL2044]|nr:hypothetical protein F4778DRAFT_797328 [Xylariomycetidae sp. FL2044]
MSPSKGQPPHKRASSFAGFFNKLLPSHRPEQGGTLRPKEATGDDDESYRDLGIDPNELKDWNLARGKPWRRLVSDHGKMPDAPSRQARPPPPSPPPPASIPSQKPAALEPAEIQAALRSKEQSRQNRRSLIESGDWLGVQGADPYTGEYTVLSPTNTLSSKDTSGTTKKELADALRQETAARSRLDQVRSAKEALAEKAKHKKEKAKLHKIEKAKEDRKRKQRSVTWSQNRRQWSSAAEPDLSPIAQSLSSLVQGSIGVPKIDNSLSVPPGPLTGPQIATHDFANPTESENKHVRTDRRRVDHSTDTIIRKPSVDTGKHAVPFTSPVTQSPIIPLYPDIKSPSRTTGLETSATDTNLASMSSTNLPMDHFADLAIPDHHLHFMPRELQRGEKSGVLKTPLDETRAAQSVRELVKFTHHSMPAALMPKTNVLEPPIRLSSLAQDTNAATATSSLSNLKDSTKPSPDPPRSVPNLLDTLPEESTSGQQASTPSDNPYYDRNDNDLSGDTAVSPSEQLQEEARSQKNPALSDNVLHRMNGGAEGAQSVSASIHITITTGSDPNLQSQQDTIPLLPEAKKDQTDGAVGITEDLTAMSFDHERQESIVSTHASAEALTTSRPTTLRSISPSLVPDPETAGRGIISDRPVTPKEKTVSILTPLSHARSAEGMSLRAGSIYAPIRDRIPARPASLPARPHQSCAELRDDTIREAARLAMGHSGAREEWINHQGSRSSSMPSSPRRNHLRARSNPVRRARQRPVGDCVVEENTRVEKSELPLTKEKAKSHPNPAVSEGKPAKKDIDNKKTTKDKGKKKVDDDDENNDDDNQEQKHEPEPDAVMTLARIPVQVAKTTGIVAVGLACTWWFMIRPAFDPESELWRRRHRQESTWEDVVVFACAGVSVLVGLWVVAWVVWG